MTTYTNYMPKPSPPSNLCTWDKFPKYNYMPNAMPTPASRPPKFIIQKTGYLKLFLKLTNMSTPSPKKKSAKTEES